MVLQNQNYFYYFMSPLSLLHDPKTQKIRKKKVLIFWFKNQIFFYDYLLVWTKNVPSRIVFSPCTDHLISELYSSLVHLPKIIYDPWGTPGSIILGIFAHAFQKLVSSASHVSSLRSGKLVPVFAIHTRETAWRTKARPCKKQMESEKTRITEK